MQKFFSLILCLTLVIGPLNAAFGSDETPKAMDAYTRDEGTGGKDGAKFYMLQAGMIATASGGSVMATCIPTSYHWAHFIFAAGAVTYIIGEIALAKETTDYHKRKKESLEIDDSKLIPPPGGLIKEAQKNTQTAAIQAALDEEVNNKSMMEKRKKWADIVSLVYDIAVISAGVEAGLSLIPTLSGFLPDSLHCYGIPPLALAVGNGLAWIYAANAAHDQSGGKLGLSSVAFMALLKLEINVGTGLAIPAVITGWGRIAYFGAAALFAKKVRDGLGERIGIADANIAKLRAILAAWNVNTIGGAVIADAAGGAAGAGGGNRGRPLPTSNYLKNNNQGTYPKPTGGCMGSNGIHSQAGCKNKMKFDPKMPKFQIGEIGQFTHHALEVANHAAADNFAGAEVSGDALIAGAARIKAIKDQVLADAQAKLDAQGGKKQDILASIDAQHKNMMEKFAEGAAKGGMGGAVADGSEKAALDAEAAGDSDAYKTKITAAPAEAAAGAGAGKPPELFSAGEETPVADATGLTEAEKDLLATDYDKNKGEYLSNNEDSLFQVITKTYVRNLDRILVRKKKLIEEAP